MQPELANVFRTNFGNGFVQSESVQNILTAWKFGTAGSSRTITPNVRDW